MPKGQVPSNIKNIQTKTDLDNFLNQIQDVLKSQNVQSKVSAQEPNSELCKLPHIIQNINIGNIITMFKISQKRKAENKLNKETKRFKPTKPKLK